MAKPKFIYPDNCTLEDSYALYDADGVTFYRYIAHREHFGFPPPNSATLKGYVDKGWFTRSANGKIDPRKADEAIAANTDQRRVLNVINSQRQASEAVEELNIPEYAVSNAREKHYKALQEEIKLEQMRGSLVDKDEYAATLFTMLRDLRNGLQVIPARVADTICSLTDPADVENHLAKEIEEVLKELSERLINNSLMETQ